MLKKGKKFEIVWVSQDRSVEDFEKYYMKMPWLAVTVQNLQLALQKLSSPEYALRGIPHLVILDAEDASIITVEGRAMVAKDKYGLEFPWRKRTISNLIPKPVKIFLSRQLSNGLSYLGGFTKGIIRSLAPDKIYNFMKTYVYPTASRVMKALFNQAMKAITNKEKV